MIRVDIQLETGVECSSTTHNVALNAANVGSYPPSFTCFCLPTHTTHLLEDVATASYVKGALNAVSIDSASCDGLSEDGDGAYTIVHLIVPATTASSTGSWSS